MQVPPTPTEDDEASLPTDHVRNGPNLNRTLTVRRKAAKRTLPWDLTEDEIQLALPRSQDEDTRATKRPRLEEPLRTSTEEATTETASHATAVALSPATAAAVDHHLADPDPVLDMQPNARTTGALRHWTPEEDVKLTSAVAKTRKTKWGKKSYIDWVTITRLVPGRTKRQCTNRWQYTLVSKIDPTTAREGQFTADEDKKLRHAVGAYVAKNWEKIAALVPGRTKTQCSSRWHDTLVSNIDPTTARAGQFTADEDKRLRHAVGAHGAKNWKKIAALVPGRTKRQCSNRWHFILVSNIEPNDGTCGSIGGYLWPCIDARDLKRIRLHTKCKPLFLRFAWQVRQREPTQRNQETMLVHIPK
jgi:hypothetical protein